MTASASEATNFWIEAGAMSGGSRNQIELPQELAEFFNEIGTGSNSTTILIKPIKAPAVACQLVYRGTDYGQWSADLWRLNLPTSKQGAPSYADNIIRIRKDDSDGERIYWIDAQQPSSEVAQRWERMAQSEGTTGNTGGAGRKFGYW